MIQTNSLLVLGRSDLHGTSLCLDVAVDNAWESPLFREVEKIGRAHTALRKARTPTRCDAQTVIHT